MSKVVFIGVLLKKVIYSVQHKKKYLKKTKVQPPLFPLDFFIK